VSPLTYIILQFVVCSTLILASGVRLSRYGDIIAEKTGLGARGSGSR